MTPEDRAKNERMAILTGWRRARSGRWMSPDIGPIAFRSSTCEHAPDFTTWERFPELQAYVRANDDGSITGAVLNVLSVESHVESQYDGYRHAAAIIYDITPTILRDAILETVGEGAPV